MQSLLPVVQALAQQVANQEHLDLVSVQWHTHQSPPILRVEVRHPSTDTSLDDCERMSRALESVLDATADLTCAYVLEVSSPGLSDFLTSDRDFSTFRGFPVRVTTTAPHRGKTLWEGNLVRRDEVNVYLSQKGRSLAIPRALIATVQLYTPPAEA
ncbi:ribosome maturation factor RimP [Parathermosynechococcus lividus]